MDGDSGIFGNNNDSLRFTSIIRQGIADLCDKTATIKTVSKRRNISSGGKTPDDVIVKCFEEFVFSVERLFEYTKEMLPDDMIQRINRWDDSVQIPSAGQRLDEKDFNLLKAGLRISEDLQKIMYKKGLKDPIAPADFDFSKYLEISQEYDPESFEDEFDPIEAGVDILGYSGRNEYSNMYTSYVIHSMNLKSFGRYDDARAFFYASLPCFAPLFDYAFLTNCINVKKKYAAQMAAGGKGVHNMIFQLHEAEFAALMNRANIVQLPDIMDCRMPTDYTPASVPGGVANK